MLQLPFGLLCELLSPCCTRHPVKQLYAFNGKQIRLLSWNVGFIFDRNLERRPLLLREMIDINPDVLLIQNALMDSSLGHKNLTSLADQNYVPYAEVGFTHSCRDFCGRIFLNPLTSIIFTAYAWLNAYFFETSFGCFFSPDAQPHGFCGFLANIFFGLVWTRGSLVLTRGHGFSRDDTLLLDSHRLITRGLIQLRGRKLWLLNFDFDFLKYDPDDTSLVERVIAWLDEGNVHHNADGVVLCGTLNAPRGSKTYNFLRLQGFSNARETSVELVGESFPYTYPTPLSTISKKIPGLQADAVWVKGVNVLSHEYVGHEADIYDEELFPSSHLGILVTP